MTGAALFMLRFFWGRCTLSASIIFPFFSDLQIRSNSNLQEFFLNENLLDHQWKFGYIFVLLSEWKMWITKEIQLHVYTVYY